MAIYCYNFIDSLFNVTPILQDTNSNYSMPLILRVTIRIDLEQYCALYLAVELRSMIRSIYHSLLFCELMGGNIIPLLSGNLSGALYNG